MKRTQPGEVLGTSFLQLDVVPDDADDVGLLLERVFEVGSGHGMRGTLPLWGIAGKKEMAGRLWKDVEGCGEDEHVWRGHSCPRPLASRGDGEGIKIKGRAPECACHPCAIRPGPECTCCRFNRPRPCRLAPLACQYGRPRCVRSEGGFQFRCPALDGSRATALLLFFVAGAQPFRNLNRTS